MNQNLLIVDDEIEILVWLVEIFRYEFDLEIGLYTANSALEALELLTNVKFDVVLTDIRMPGMDGITLFQKIKKNWPRCKTIFLTGYGNFDDMYK
ncbi:response regulator transcription factor, partial [Enterobacter sichuanensis]|uniref:response regulator transcription factor n=1 Tax=Enterobacter sichuanensis TaxID=2071710 RepID=UPI0021CE7708